MDMWIIYDSAKAEAAGCDLEKDRVVYALMGSDVADIYNNMRDDGDLGASASEWDALPLENQAWLIRQATEPVEDILGNADWPGAIRDAIEKALHGQAQATGGKHG